MQNLKKMKYLSSKDILEEGDLQLQEIAEMMRSMNEINPLSTYCQHIKQHKGISLTQQLFIAEEMRKELEHSTMDILLVQVMTAQSDHMIDRCHPEFIAEGRSNVSHLARVFDLRQSWDDLSDEERAA